MEFWSFASWFLLTFIKIWLISVMQQLYIIPLVWVSAFLRLRNLPLAIDLPLIGGVCSFWYTSLVHIISFFRIRLVWELFGFNGF